MSTPSGLGPGYAGGQQPYGQPGQMQGGGQQVAPPPGNYMGQSVLAIFCCWPLAIPALINATQVQSKWMMGDQAGAHAASREAKKWSNLAIWLGVAWIVLVILFYIAAFFFAFSFFNFTVTVNGTPVTRP